MARPPTPPPDKRQVITFVSPKVADIVFYELRDTRVARYKTPPAYGTAHPKAVKYPNHKLVFVAPVTAEDDGQQRWYYAASRADQDDYNFEFSSGDSRLTRTYFIPRADFLAGAPDYVVPTVGDEDAVFSDYKYTDESVRRVDDKMLDSYFVVIQHHFTRDLKITSMGEEGTGRGETGSETRLGTSKNAVAIAGGVILQRSSRLTEFDQWHNTENRLALRTGVNQLSQGVRPGFEEIDTRELSGTEPTSKGEPSFSKSLVTTDIHGADAVWAANRKTRVPRPAQGSELTTFLGGGVVDVDVRLVADTASADSGFYIVSSQVAPLGGGDALKTTKTIPGYPTLVDSKYDPSLNAMLTVTKDVVAAGTLGSINGVGDITEVQSHDAWRSIQIRTVGVGVPKTEILPGVFSFSFPAVLVSAEMVGDLAYAYNVDNYDWDYDVAMVFDVSEAFSAAVEGRIIRVVTNDPTGVLAAYPPVVFKPESTTISMVASGAYASPATVWAKVSARTWQTPMALCAGITISAPAFAYGGIDTGSESNLTIDATTPATIPTGWITVGATSQRLRIGFWEVQIRQVYSPGV